ncbi:MAG: hypothetical protein ACAI34_02320 [Verrucomicrobium sp.]
MVEFERTDERELAPSMRMKICVAGVGGGGLNVLDRISLDRMMEATLVSMHTDVRVLGHSMTSVKIQLGAERMRGIGSGGDPENGYEAAQDSRESIRAALQGHDMVFVCCGLGGGTGSGAAPVVAEVAKEIGAMVFVFATMPFSFEGRRRIQQAEISLEHLGQVADALILFENNRMGELTLPKEGIQKAFSQADQLIGHSVRAIATMVMQPGIVRMGIADLLTALRGPNSRCLFGFGEARGSNRVADALKRALKSPLVNQGMLLQNARNLLVHVAGGESLTLAEVESLMKQLGKHVPEETQIMFGLAVEPKLGDMISVTLVSSLSVQEMSPDSVLGRTERSVGNGAGAAPAPGLPEEFLEPAPVQQVPEPVYAPAAEVQAPAPVAYEPAPTPVPAPVAVVPQQVAPAQVHYQNGHAPAPVQMQAPVPVQAAAPATVVAPAPVVQAPVAQSPVMIEPQLFQLEAPASVEPDLFGLSAPQVQPQVQPAPVAYSAPAPAPVQAPVPAPAPVAAASIFVEEFESAPDVEERYEEPVEYQEPVHYQEEPVYMSASEPIPAEDNEDVLRAEEQMHRAPVEPVAPVAAKASIFSIIEDDEDTEEEERSAVSYPDTPGSHWADKYLNSPSDEQSSGPVSHEEPVRRPEARPAVSAQQNGGAAAPAPVPTQAPAPAPVPASGPAAGGKVGSDFKQSTFDLNQEEVARFKGTDKTIVEGEDLDVPTWMRMRQKLKR